MKRMLKDMDYFSNNIAISTLQHTYSGKYDSVELEALKQ